MTQIVAPRDLRSLLGAQVRVYRNLTQKTWSVQYREPVIRKDNGRVSYIWRVAGHDRAVVLADVHFHVSAAGYERVRGTGRKDVHAWAIGHLLTTASLAHARQGGETDFFLAAAECKRAVGYNPRKAEGPHFSRKDTGKAIFQSTLAFLDASGGVWIDRETS
jgi:hypothetical protein